MTSFHVADARGSQFVPAQSSFVVPFGVRSVLGFGGVIPGGSFFVVLMFSRAPISAEVAELFRTIALGAKLVLLAHAGRKIFAA